ncbi:MAG: hypothetical protein ACAI38_23860 [Myxococcota bacterium]|nr:hypothetical protein [Myxococcota bacterium]
MDLATFLGKWDNGLGVRARQNDRALHASEIDRSGGVAAFLGDLRQLRPDEQQTVTRMLQDVAMRDQVEGALDPTLARFLQEFDRNNNHALDVSEVGGAAFQRFRTAASALSPQTRRRVAERISDSVLQQVGPTIAEALPETFNPHDFGALRFIDRADRQLGERARAFLRETLHLDPAVLTSGLRREHLGAPVIPATPAQAIVRDLRAEIGERSMSLVELGRFVAARADRRTVTLSVADLAEGLAREPQRFEGNRFEVSGYAREISREEGKYLSYSFLKEKWVRVPYVEAVARLGESPGASGPGVEVFERQDGSKLLSGFWLSMSDPRPTARDANQRMSVVGTIRRSEGGAYRLFAER